MRAAQRSTRQQNPFQEPERLRPRQRLGTGTDGRLVPVLRGATGLCQTPYCGTRLGAGSCSSSTGQKPEAPRAAVTSSSRQPVLGVSFCLGLPSPEYPSLGHQQRHAARKVADPPHRSPPPSGRSGGARNPGQAAHARRGPSQRGPAHPRRLVLAQSKTLCMAVTPSRPRGATSPPVMMA